MNKFFVTVKDAIKYIPRKISSFLEKKSLKHRIISWQQLFELYNIKVDLYNDVLITSFYNEKISKSTVDYQRRTFETLNIPLDQSFGNCSHGEFLTKMIKTYSHKKFIIFFDIDCIPLHQFALIKILQDIQDESTISGPVQTANHKNNGANIYIGPFCMAISTKIIRELKITTLEKDDLHDVGGSLSTLALKNNISLKYWFPTSVEEPRWKLYPNSFFGKGTTYDGLIYHAFESRLNNNSRFIKKCKFVINQYK
jgi:hypothetical protein